MIVGAAGDHHRVDVAADQHLAMAVGGRHRVVGAAIAHQRQRADPARPLLAGVVGRRRQVVEALEVPRQPRADRLVMAAQPIAETPAAIRQQLLVQRSEAGGMRQRHQVVPPDQSDQPLHFALVVALARAAEPIGEQVMRLQLAEHARPLPCSVAQDPRHRQLGVVVQDRRRHAAEERERRNVTGAERLRRLRRIGLHEAGIAVRQVHREEVDLPLHPADHRQRLAEVRLRVPRIMPQRHKHLALPLTLRQHVILHDRQPADVAVLVAQTLEDPLRRVPLLRRAALILFQDPIDDPHERIQLRTRRRPAAPVSRRHRERQHLRHRPRIDPKPTRRLSPTDPLDPHRVADPPIQLHALHPPPSAFNAKSFPRRNFTPAQPTAPAASLRDFVSGAYNPNLYAGMLAHLGGRLIARGVCGIGVVTHPMRLLMSALVRRQISQHPIQRTARLAKAV